jgi:hypothetical protein
MRRLTARRSARPFSVLLRCPEGVAENFGTDTYYAFVRARSATDAVQQAQERAEEDYRPMRAGAAAADFAPLLVIRGHRRDQAVHLPASVAP